MTNPAQFDADESALAEQLQALDRDAAPVDPVALTKAREASMREYESQTVTLSRPATRSHRDSPASAWTTLVVAVMLVGVSFWMWFSNQNVPTNQAFASVLDRVSEADTLRLKVTTKDGQTEVLVKQPGKVRWNDAPDRYRIANGARLWRIDEVENTAKIEKAGWSAETPASERLALLEVLGVQVDSPPQAWRLKPVETIKRGTESATSYRAEFSGRINGGEKQSLVLEGLFQSDNGRLIELAVYDEAPPVRDRKELVAVKLLAMNEAVDDSVFVVAKSLSEDGRIGKVSDVQGIITLRAALRDRWTPIGRQTLLRPGDWLRTDSHGPNAVQVTLTSGVQITLGPGSLLELQTPHRAKLHMGDAQVAMTDAEREFELLAPAKQQSTVKPQAPVAAADKGKSEGKKEPAPRNLFRVTRDEKFVALKSAPQWLLGFEGTTTSEKLGALIATIDGRNEPLTVGYHKVDVEIRDQIARTTIEESFVNHTGGRLEGVFHFPLPNDASISGFGMWIGNQLVEADVVEKERAREIYETILRERRDPGLLEWTAGNVFKARVFPIEPHSEKRIKIVYTQVLPLKGNRYRYSYGLQSDLLRQNPVRELAINVLVHSELPLKSVTSPTYDCRVSGAPQADGNKPGTTHSSKLEFQAQEFVPQRDFEVVCEVDGRQNDVVVIPHRRGDDGYFLMQLTPPSQAGNWQRELVADGQPLDLLLLCDTSASMNETQRKQQSEFVAAVLSSLSEKDTFNLAGCDVTCVWALNESLPATAESIAKARDFLTQRDSMGWTDLDQAFESVLPRCKPTTQVIYVGDGIVTARDANPQSFAQRLLARMAGPRPALHAVTVGNESDAVVLKAIAQAGHGSLRAISGEQTPQQIALELLNELAQPGLTDIKLEFRGLPVAAIYPETLPNIAAGSQQIVLGRYLRAAGAASQAGKPESLDVIVTGRRGTEQVKFATKVSFSRDEEGNSFIPRLWARMHLDHLLAQGRNDFIKDEVIRLSEEFHIITPYTSLLVLETDADRERFGVKRRYLMRDGEQFFADGRSATETQLKQQYLRDAGAWRTGIRTKLLRELSRLGRNAEMFNRQYGYNYYENFLGDFSRVTASTSLGRMGGPWGGPMGGGMGGFGMGGGGGYAGAMPASGPMTLDMFDLDEPEERNMPMSSVSGMKADALADAEELSVGERLDGGERDLGELQAGLEFQAFDSDGLDKSMRFTTTTWSQPGFGGRGGALKAEGMSIHSPYAQQPFAKRKAAYDPYGQSRSHLINWLDSLAPTLPATAVARPPKKPTFDKWSPEALQLSKSLLRKDGLKELGAAGVEVRQLVRTTSTRWSTQVSQSESLTLSSAKGWLKRSLDARNDVNVQWCDEQDLGTYSRAFLLGRIRKSKAADLNHGVLALDDHSLVGVHDSYPQAEARVEAAPGEARQTLVVTQVSNGELQYELRLLIDTARHVVLEQSWKWPEAVTKTTFENFVSVHGQWWATKVSRDDQYSQTKTVTDLKITGHDAQQFKQALTAGLVERANVRFIRLPTVTVERAEQAVAESKAGFDEHLIVLLHFNMEQQWDKVFEQLAAIEKLPGPQRGVWWLRTSLLRVAGRNEEARERLLAEAQRIVANPGKPEDAGLDDWLAEHVRGTVHGIVQSNEYLRLLDVLQPVYERQPPHTQGPARLLRERMATIEALGRVEEARAMRERVKALFPWDQNLITQEARTRFAAGEHAAAITLLEAELTKDIWTRTEKDPFRDTAVELLEGRRMYAELVRFLDKEFERRQPAQQYVYSRFLSALGMSDDFDRALATARQWMREAREQKGQAKGRNRDALIEKLQAAINFSLGNGYNYYSNRIEFSLLPDLTETARAFARDVQWNITSQIIGHHQFADRDEIRTLRAEWWQILKAEAETMPANQLAAFVSRLLANDPVISDESWKQIAATVRARWQKETDFGPRDQFAEAMISIYSSRFSDSDLLPFLRECIATTTEERRDNYVSRLFELLLQRTWTIELERESFELITKLSASRTPAEREFTQVGALHRWVDRMLAMREQAAMDKLESNAAYETIRAEQLTRKQYAAKRAEYRRVARERVATYLIEKRTQTEGVLGHWLGLEAAYLDIGLGRNLDRAIAEAWAILGERPQEPAENPSALDDEEGDDVDENVAPQTPVTLGMLQNRALTTVINLMARRSAKQAEVDRLMKYFDAGVALKEQSSWGWKQLKFQFLVALDRPEELEMNLRHWLKGDPDIAPWRQMLAVVLAERGNLKEAVELFEIAEKKNELSASDYRQLANWYLVLNRKADSERALLAEWNVQDEYRIQQFLYAALQPWQRSDQPLPSSLDERVLRAFRAIFKKSAQPQNYTYLLRQFYDASRDFRLLSMLPDAVIGLTPQQVYPLLTSLDGSVLSELREEAAADKVIEHIRELRAEKPASNDPALSHQKPADLRALDLLEAMIERRSSEVLNQPGPHVTAAVAALKRAFDREWASGEQRQMADWLASLGNITQRDLANEQIRQLNALLDAHKPGTEDRIFIAMSVAQCLAHRGELNNAIAVAEAALRDFPGETWPAQLNGPFAKYIDFLGQAKRFAAAETVIKRHIAKPENEGQASWMKSQLTSLYMRAFSNGGSVSLGEGVELLKNIVTYLLTESRNTEQHARYTHINELLQCFRTARDQKLEFRELFVTFAFTQLPELLANQADYYENIISQTTDTLRELVSPREAFHFLLVRMENYPRRLRYYWNNPWQQHGYRLAELRTQAGNLGELEPRLLKLVLAELRRELEQRDQYNVYIYRRHSGYFWAEKTADFARVAEEVAAANKNSGRMIAHVASYFWHGLDNPTRAIELLFVAHRQGVLHQQGIELLVEALHHTKRYGESIALLEPLIDSTPDHLRYRTDLMIAYYETQRGEQLNQLLKQTDEHFRKGRRWNENVAASLGHTCIRMRLDATAVGYLLEAITLYQRHQNPADGQYDTLSSYYRDLASAYVRSGKTVEAVDAASSAIVLWGSAHTHRTHALESLKQVLREAKDRTAYVKWLDEEVLKDGRDRPLIRKYLGRVYFEENKFDASVTQLKIAAELSPEDREVQQWLLESLDKLDQKDAAIAQVINMLKYNRRDLALYKQLAERLAADPSRAERAATSMIENLPTETESHAALAELRQQQDRWEDAASHWRRVAELRSLEPTGLLQLAGAQLHLKQWDAADNTLQKLEATKWPGRFTDVRNRIDGLRAQLRTGRMGM